jgi:hypothetical protein
MTVWVHFVAVCAQCRQEKEIPVFRDEFGICAECEDEIAASLAQDEPVVCDSCRGQFSWLWCRADARGNFLCRNCQPAGLCHLCHSRPAAISVEDTDRRKFACRECATALSACG